MYRQRLRYAARDPYGALAFIRAIKGNNRTPIISTSIGRVGSTLLFQSLVEGRLRSMLGRYDPRMRHLLGASCWDLNQLRHRPAAIYKSHDVPPRRSSMLSGCKVVFLHGRPSDVVMSLLNARERKGREWIAEHFAHMHAAGPFEHILQRDVLRLGLHLSAWPAFRDTATLCLRYETMWDNIDVLSDFLGFSVTLPKREHRSSIDVSPELAEQARRSYAELDEVEASLPDYHVV